MAWVRIDDQFTDHPKAAEAGPLGVAMQVAGLCYCNRHLTDGFISRAVAARLLDFTGIAEDIDAHEVGQQVMAFRINWPWVVDRLEAAGMWEPVDGGWRIHDYLQYNPSRAEVEAKRDTDLARKRNPRRVPTDSATFPNGIPGQSEDVPTGIQMESCRNPSAPNPNPNPNPERELTPDVVHTTSPPRPPRRGSGKASAPSHAPTPTVRDVVSAITQALAYDDSARLSEKEYERLVASAEQIVGAGGTPEQVPVRAERYGRKYPSIAVTHGGLAGHWGELAVEPVARESPNGRASPVTFAQQIEENNKRHDEEFQAALRGQSNAAIGISGADESTRGRLPD